MVGDGVERLNFLLRGEQRVGVRADVETRVSDFEKAK